jgi:hypothetical protein
VKHLGRSIIPGPDFQRIEPAQVPENFFPGVFAKGGWANPDYPRPAM